MSLVFVANAQTVFLIEVFFASALKNKSGKTKEFDSSFFRSTVYFARLCLGDITDALFPT